MAYVFAEPKTATVRGKNSTGESYSVNGVTTADITPAAAAAQLNKIFAIAGKTAVGDLSMKRITTEEAESE